MTVENMLIDEIEELEFELAWLNKNILKLNKWSQWRIIGRIFKKQLPKTIEKRDEIFRELREKTREKYPERFISSEGSK